MMPRQRGPWVVALIGALLATGSGFGLAQAQPQDEAPRETVTQRQLQFLQGLRQRGYNDLAQEYIERLRQAPDTPADLKAILDYEEGRGLLEQAANAVNPEQKRVQLEQARQKIEAFAQSNPNHPLANEALAQIARLLFERGQTAALQAGEAENDKAKQTYLVEARASYQEARGAFDRAVKPLRDAFASYHAYIPEEDPKHAEKDRIHVALMEAELQRSLVDYEEAQTYPVGSEQRTKLLDIAFAAFEDVYKRYRTQPSGIYARLMMAKCYEEKGQLGPAMGLYDELMEHQARDLIEIQRKVKYFQIIVDGKRGEHAKAVDRAVEWLNTYKDAAQTAEGMGVRFQLAKNILAQLPEFTQDNQKVAIRRAVDLLSEVVRYYTPDKPEAVRLLQQYKDQVDLNRRSLVNLTYEEAYSQAESALSTHEWKRALQLLEHAVIKANPERDPEKANRARYLMAYASFENNQWYQADVIAEHLARHYPKFEMSPKATEIGMVALTQAYNTYKDVDQQADLERLVGLADYTIKTWPESDQANVARLTLGQIEMGRGNYAEAARAFESVSTNSARYLNAEVQAGDAHWRLGQRLREAGKTAEADSEAKTAQDLLEKSLEARKEAHTPITDPGYITNANALAEIHRANGKPQDALALVEPITKALSASTNSGDTAQLMVALLTTQLRAHIASGQSDEAIADMKALEGAGGTGPMLTQLYYELSRTLKQEFEAEASKSYTTNLNQTRKAYGEFLQALAKSQSGQTYDSLMFAGESLLSIGLAKESEAIFKRVLDTYSKDPEFTKQTGYSDRLLRAEIRLAEAERKERKFAESLELLQNIQKENPRLLEPYMEIGYTLEDWAKTDAKRWSDSYKHWKNLSAQLQRSRPRPAQYYEAIYHIAVALQGMKQPQSAAATLKSVMALSPEVGSAEMKKKYQNLLNQVSR